MTTKRLGRLEILLAVNTQELFFRVNFPLQALLGLLFLEAILLFHVVNQFFDCQFFLLWLILVICLQILHQFVALLLLLEYIFVKKSLFEVWRKLLYEILVQLLLLKILFCTAQLDKGFYLVQLIALILSFDHFSWLRHSKDWCNGKLFSHSRFGIWDTLMLWSSVGCWFLLQLLVFDRAFWSVVALDHLFESVKLFVLNFSGIQLSDFWGHSNGLSLFEEILGFA